VSDVWVAGAGGHSLTTAIRCSTIEFCWYFRQLVLHLQKEVISLAQWQWLMTHLILAGYRSAANNSNI